MRIHVALYGNVAILRGFCSTCRRTALIVEGVWECCGRQATVRNEDKLQHRRMLSPDHRRTTPTPTEKRKVALRQRNRCFYCDRIFGTFVMDLRRNKKLVALKITMDHMTPFSFKQNNSKVNYVGACQQCNALKSALVFNTVEEAQIHVREEIKKRYQEALLEEGLQSDVRS